MLRGLTGLGVAVAALSAAANPRFDVIESAATFQSAALAVSADGCLVVGHDDYEAFRWRDGIISPLVGPPDTNPQIAYALTPDGRVVVGYAGHNFFRLDEQGYQLLPVPGGAGNPTEARAVSADGNSVGGCTHAATFGSHCDWPFLWRSGSGATLLNGLSGGIEYGSVEAISADGSLAAGVAGGRAVLWHPQAGTVQGLGTLPGHSYSEIRDLTPGGGVAVGGSGPNGPSDQRRGFRWTAATGMQDLGPDTRIAHAVSADGTRIVGEGESAGDGPFWYGAFVWDALRGARPLADVLHAEYGLNLGGFHLDSATAISSDGKTIVGTGYGFNGEAWRARLREDGCAQSGLGVIDLLEYAPPTLDGPISLRVDSVGRLSLSGHLSRNVVRIDTDLANYSNPVVQTLLDFTLDPLPDPEAWDVPVVLATGGDGSVYVGAHTRKQLFRVAPDGAVHVVFDGSPYPNLGDDFYPIYTAPVDAEFGPDGSLYVAADARVLRVDPDGSVHELIDAAEAQEVTLGWSDPLDLGLYWVEVDPQGRVFVTSGRGLLVLDRDGNVLDSLSSWELGPVVIRGIEVDAEGGLWLFGYGHLSRLHPDGTLEVIFDWEIPDGAGGHFDFPDIRDLLVDDALNVYYSNSQVIVRRTPEGALTRVLAPETLNAQGREVGPMYVPDMTLSGGLLFAVDYGSDRIFRVELPRPPTACANGLDDDGDGVVDYPEDPGCLSAEDEGERSFERPCDNGLDDDGDGAVDFPADPSCFGLKGVREDTQCDDGVDNDGDGAVDWDGAYDQFGDYRPPDPECGGDPLRVIEHPWYCGLGFEVALVALPIASALRRWRRRRVLKR